MRRNFYFNLVVLILFSTTLIFGQLYQGPAQGSVASGAVISTGTFIMGSPNDGNGEKSIRNKINYIPEAIYIDGLRPNVEMKYTNDDNSLKERNDQVTLLLKNFNGISQTNSIPPDPHIAVGPNHVVGVVNSRFAIWDKEGNLLKNINADTWYSNVVQGVGSFDPKVLYDHFAKRWIMVWLDQDDNSQRGYFLLSVSADSNAIGTWYNWALPSNVNGTTNNGSWGDYQGVGFDHEAIYITANQFSFSSSFQYVKIRIVPKAQLYANTGGAVTFTDLWDIRYPSSLGSRVFNIRPSIHYSQSNSYNLLHANSGSSNFFVLYKITNPLTNPVLTGINVPVTNYSGAPNANQLGGSSVLIEGAGSALRCEPVYRDGFLWATHTIRNPVHTAYSSARYVKINTTSNLAEEDAALGAEGFWHFYTALAVDKDHNIALTYSRSGLTEYAGAYYTSKLSTSSEFSGTKALAAGLGNYVVTFGGSRNRWGDYNGIWIDPSDENDFWMLTEYAAGTNTWGTRVGKLRLIPYTNPTLFSSVSEIEFGKVEKSFVSEIKSFLISNYGNQNLIINDITFTNNSFRLASNINFPLTINLYDSLTINVEFAPDSAGIQIAQMIFNSNDPNFSGISLKGIGFEVLPAFVATFYASSGNINNGNMYTIDKSSGTSNLIGNSNYSEVSSIAINPKTKLMYGIVSTSSLTRILRVNGLFGDSYELFNIPVPNGSGLAFDTSGTLYLGARNGQIHEININSQTNTLISTASIPIADIAFDPFDNQLYASNFFALGANRDRLFKINLQTGDTTLVGKSGFGIVSNGLAFDENGNLFGVVGSSTVINNFISLDKETGVGNLVGSTGLRHLIGLAYVFDGTTNISEDIVDNNIPSDYKLSQNYPNPFNPSTVIEFSLPNTAYIELNVYNLLGEKIVVLARGMKEAGNYKVSWDISEIKSQLSSGIYFYELKGEDVEKNNFSIMKKMILMK